MNHVLQMDIETIKRFIQTAPLGVVAEIKKEFLKHPTHEKVLAVKEELEKRLA
jgi:hypothetical protein